MPRPYDVPNQGDILYYGDSDFLAQVADQVANSPDSCMTKNLVAWYNSLYSELSEFADCRYQVEINEDLCPVTEPETEDDMVLLLLAFLRRDPGLAARVLLNRVCRETRRQLRLSNSPSVE